MPYKNTYYSQGLYDQMSEDAKAEYGDDPKRMDKLIKASIAFYHKHLEKKRKEKETTSQ